MDCNHIIQTNTVSVGALSYSLRSDSFLNHSQAHYALKQLWRLVSFGANWEGPPIINFNAITREQVEAELRLPGGKLPWVLLSSILPRHESLNIDTDSLPSLCQVHSGITDSVPGVTGFRLDLVSATFIALSRWEELRFPVYDSHGRHDERHTQAYRQNFFSRPVIDEWALVVRRWLEILRPEWHAGRLKSSTCFSHDIDIPWYFKNLKRVSRGLAKGLIRQKSLARAIENVSLGFKALANPKEDPCYTGVLDLLDFDRSFGLNGTFYFMTADPDGVDEGYDLSRSEFRDLVSVIRDAGHHVGWHVGKRASTESATFERELSRYRAIVGNEPVDVRYHYLACDVSKSWSQLDSVGVRSDSSMGYNDLSFGYRSGTAHDYPVFDVVKGCELKLIERPLVLMDAALLQHFDAKQKTQISNLIYVAKERTYNVNGSFSVLLHNNCRFENPIGYDCISRGLISGGAV